MSVEAGRPRPAFASNDARSERKVVEAAGVERTAYFGHMRQDVVHMRLSESRYEPPRTSKRPKRNSRVSICQ
jgi:hypothetical protein